MNIYRRPPYHNLNQILHQNLPLASAFFADGPRVVICMTYIRGVGIKIVPLYVPNKLKFLKPGFVVMVLDFAANCGRRLNSAINA